jgi:hypothetical protein
MLTPRLVVEEIAAIFGDSDEVAVYRRDIDIEVVVERGIGDKQDGNMEHVESLKGSSSDVADKV